ncbi:MAG: site-specific integrase [Bacteroidota bacterium]|nr:site-specific integrase [Bacteroidota bacterium]
MLKISQGKWDERQSTKGLNSYLDELQRRIVVAHHKLIDGRKKITAISIKNKFRDQGEKRTKILKENLFSEYKAKIKIKEREFLSQAQLDRIIDRKLQSGRLEQVRNIFVFCCYSGLSYADLKKLSRKEIMIGIDGEQWIMTKIKKTETSLRIPLLKPALDIIEKYKDHPRCENEGIVLPVMSNQKMNSYLKEILKECNIPQNLTFHLARHTFATTVTLTNGVQIESVNKMLGHLDIKTTQHYAKVIDEKVSRDMQALAKKT